MKRSGRTKRLGRSQLPYQIPVSGTDGPTTKRRSCVERLSYISCTKPHAASPINQATFSLQFLSCPACRCGGRSNRTCKSTRKTPPTPPSWPEKGSTSISLRCANDTPVFDRCHIPVGAPRRPQTYLKFLVPPIVRVPT